MSASPQNGDDTAARIGERLAALRAGRGLRVVELARRAGVSASLVSQIERGQSRPSVTTLVVSAEGVGAPIDGEVVQDSSTAEMIFGVAELLAFCSRSFTLERGGVVMTGTPWGCGGFMDPPRALHPGDRRDRDERVGVLRNPVVAP